MTTQRFVYGPFPFETRVVIMAEVDSVYYVMKRDVDPNQSPYFGPSGNVDFINFNLNENILTSENQGFAYSDALEAPVLRQGSTGVFDYTYSGNFDDRVPLTAGELLTLVVDNQNLIFRSKTLQDETTDAQAFASNPSDYEPTYQDAPVLNYFFVPIVAYRNDDCQLFENGAYLAYSNISFPIYYTTLSYCQNKITNPLCAPGEVCGEGEPPCIGFCAENTCNPVEEGIVACTRREAVDTSLLDQPWFLPVFISLIVFIGIVAIGLTYFLTKQ